MSKVKVAAVQMRCAPTVEENLQHAEALVREAAANGAQIILLPELWERPYFCQQRRYDFYQYALPTEENPVCCYHRHQVSCAMALHNTTPMRHAVAV